jgi:HSP20 family molecular chaperone IbpA
MTGETKRDEFEEIEEIIRRILERTIRGQEGMLPPSFRIIISSGEIKGGRSHGTAPVPCEVEEPSTEVYEESGQIKILAEVPGADLNTIHLQVTGRVLRIYADGGERRYKTTLELPPVQAETMASHLTHGVLEITFARTSA